MLSVIGPLTPSAPFASTSSFSSRLPDSIFLSALERVAQERVDVGVLGRLVASPSPPQAATPSASAARRASRIGLQ